MCCFGLSVNCSYAVILFFPSDSLYIELFVDVNTNMIGCRHSTEVRECWQYLPTVRDN